MKDGLYTAIIHKYQEVFKVMNGKVFLLEQKGKKHSWCETVMEEKRKAFLQPISEEQLAGMFIEARKDYFYHVNKEWYERSKDL